MHSRALNIHERFLRHIWSKQYLRHELLHTVDGRSLRIVCPGRLNADSGPDVRDAVLQIGRATYHGDVEIHRTVVEWIRHMHHDDPCYNNVILHVVLERPVGGETTVVPSGRHVPVLVLESFLSESIHALWQKAILDERLYSRTAIPCADKNHLMARDLIAAWIQHLSVERLELKLRRFDERLKELAHQQILAVREHNPRSTSWRVEGNADDLPPALRELTPRDLARREYWDQLLYEGIMEGLGYSKNREPFVRLARSVTLREFRTQHIEDNEVAIQVLLMGAAGLLPRISAVHDTESRAFTRMLIGEWKIRKKLYRSAVLHVSNWQFFPTRPSNFPTLRIAAASVLVKRILCEDLFRGLIEMLKTFEVGSATYPSVCERLAVTPLPFWRNHYQFNHPARKPTQVLGLQRIGELITNTVVPLALLYARTFKDRSVRERTLQLFHAAPPAPENSITRLMQKHLLRGTIPLTSVADQQGIIQLYKYYCLEGRCVECAVGDAMARNSDKDRQARKESL